jgi:hypothetical protein
MSVDAKQEPSVSFSHVQLYVDRVEELAVYKELESRLNVFADKMSSSAMSLVKKKELWLDLFDSSKDELHAYVPQNRDVVRQLLAGFGFRVTGVKESSTTRSVLVTSRDPQGVQIIVTALLQQQNESHDDDNLFFRAGKCVLTESLQIVSFCSRKNSPLISV